MSEPMILAYLTNVYARATDTFIRNEVLRLRERGHTVHTFSIRRTDDAQVIDEEVHREQAGTVYIVPWNLHRGLLAALKILVLSPTRFFRSLLLAWRTSAPGLGPRIWQLAYFVEAAFLASQMLARRVQHLHNHIGQNSATVAMLASTLSGIPYSLAIHGPYIFRAPEYWSLGEKIVRASFVTCISHFTMSQCMIYIPYAHWGRLHVVRCGPEPAFIRADPIPLPDKPQLVWVGRICEEKAVPIIMNAANRLAEDGIDFNLVLVGDGPLRPEIETWLSGHGLQERVHITGWLDSEAVRAQICAARAMVMPSFAEGLPVVIMEALSLGRPVISTYIAGIPELVQPGRTGWLVPAGSVDDLAVAMRDALQASSERLEEMGRLGREAVLRLHNIETEIVKLEHLLSAQV